MAVYVQPQIRRGDYKAFKQLMPNDKNLPDAYDQWLKVQAQEKNKIIKAGNRVQEVEVDADEFIRYCRTSRIDTDSAALGAFTVAKATKQKY